LRDNSEKKFSRVFISNMTNEALFQKIANDYLSLSALPSYGQKAVSEWGEWSTEPETNREQCEFEQFGF
jgi:hypothetical protein